MGAVIYMLIKKKDYESTSGETVFSNSSTIFVRQEEDGKEAVLYTVPVYGAFGFANYTCEPSGEIQFIDTVTSAHLIGLDTTWHKIHLRGVIENTATHIFNLEDNDYDVTVSEPGAYYISATVVVVVEAEFNNTLTACIFADEGGQGMLDVLRRPGYQCDNMDFIGDIDFGPILVVHTSDSVFIRDPSDVKIRLLIISDEITVVGIISARLNILKN